MDRRRALQYGGATAAVASGISASGTAAADHEDAQPSDVTIFYDKEYLETYAPLLELSQRARELLIGLYGWVARSDDYGTDVLVYWTSYLKQDASRAGEWLLGGIDGHHGDHEPIQIEVDQDTGEVVTIRASIYHWIKGEVPVADAPMQDRRVRLRVIDPWHQYTAASPDAPVQDLEVRNLGNEWESWLANGMEDAVLPGASRNPWLMRSQPDWWRDGTFGISRERLRVDVARGLGIDTVGSLEAQ